MPDLLHLLRITPYELYIADKLEVSVALSTEKGVRVPLEEAVDDAIGGDISYLGQKRGGILSEIEDVKLRVLEACVKFALEEKH